MGRSIRGESRLLLEFLALIKRSQTGYEGIRTSTGSAVTAVADGIEGDEGYF